MPLAILRSPTGIGHLLENAALRTKVKIDYRITTVSLQVLKSLMEAGIAYSGPALVGLPPRRSSIGALRYAPLSDPVLTHQLGVAATSQLELPREFTAKLGDTLRAETGRLIKSGRWPARFLPPQPWDPRLV